MKFSVMITTRNRCEDLRRTCARLLTLQPVPDEVFICADGCTDETVAMLRQEFAAFQLVQNEPALGSVASRDRLLRLATGDVVVSFDDDSYPVADDFFARLPTLCAAHPEAAVITFPELRDGGVFATDSKTDKSPGHFVAAYPNCAAAMRRKFYLRQPGFPRFFGHMYEETDYALQCYAAGTSVWFEPSLVVRHHLSNVQRQLVRRHHQNARNELWSVWLRCPWPQLPVVSLFRVWRQFRYACSEGFDWAVREPLWWCSALSGLGRCFAARVPVPWARYLAWMQLARKPVTTVNELRRNFPFATLP